MKTRVALRFVLVGLCTAALFSGSGLAQQAPNLDPIKGPESSSAQFGDWVMRCSSIQETKACELVQQLQQRTENGGQVPIALLAVGRAAKDQPLKFIVQLPSNIIIASGIVVETKPEKPLAGSFHRCLPAGCFADLVLTDDMQRKWQQRKEPGTVTFHDGANRRVTLPISFSGFAQAMTAMTKETR